MISQAGYTTDNLLMPTQLENNGNSVQRMIFHLFFGLYGSLSHGVSNFFKQAAIIVTATHSHRTTCSDFMC